MGRRRKNFFGGADGAEETPAVIAPDADAPAEAPAVMEEEKEEQPVTAPEETPEPEVIPAKAATKDSTEQAQPLRVNDFERKHLK